MNSASISSSETVPPKMLWSECYPPDYDHGGEPLLGSDPEAWVNLLRGVAFFGARCLPDGRFVVVVAAVDTGFVHVRGQCAEEGAPLDPAVAGLLSEAEVRVPLDPGANDALQLELELDGLTGGVAWETVARRMEIDLLSTIACIAGG